VLVVVVVVGGTACHNNDRSVEHVSTKFSSSTERGNFVKLSVNERTVRKDITKE
jgi:hypothetical protein